MLHENIKNLRKSRGMTQEELASRLHIVRQTVSKWEKGYSVPDAEMLRKLADALETDTSSLLGETAEENIDAVAEQLSRINTQLAIRNRDMENRRHYFGDHIDRAGAFVFCGHHRI